MRYRFQERCNHRYVSGASAALRRCWLRRCWPWGELYRCGGHVRSKSLARAHCVSGAGLRSSGGVLLGLYRLLLRLRRECLISVVVNDYEAKRVDCNHVVRYCVAERVVDGGCPPLGACVRSVEWVFDVFDVFDLCCVRRCGEVTEHYIGNLNFDIRESLLLVRCYEFPCVFVLDEHIRCVVVEKVRRLRKIVKDGVLVALIRQLHPAR